MRNLMRKEVTPAPQQINRLPYEVVALVLQGGGALGAYQAGVYEALAEADIHRNYFHGLALAISQRQKQAVKIWLLSRPFLWLADIDGQSLLPFLVRGDLSRGIGAADLFAGSVKKFDFERTVCPFSSRIP